MPNSTASFEHVPMFILKLLKLYNWSKTRGGDCEKGHEKTFDSSLQLRDADSLQEIKDLTLDKYNAENLPCKMRVTNFLQNNPFHDASQIRRKQEQAAANHI